jgi:hypothetical protein
MLADLSLASFAEHLNTKFKFMLDETNAVEMELVEATDLTTTPRQDQFALTFQGPPQGVLPQRMYTVEHEKLGRLPLFITPISADANGVRYEAAFNRLRK